MISNKTFRETGNRSRGPSTSRYTGLRLIERGGDMQLEMGRSRVFPTTDEDSEYKVVQEDLGRLDIIANKVYGDLNLWWVLGYANNMTDAFAGFVVGDVLRVPPLSQVRALVER